MMIFLNDSLSSMIGISEPRDRIFGTATAVVSSPWSPAADASISPIRMFNRNTITSAANTTGIPPHLIITNSIFDDCSPQFGADAGCGRDLQCNKFSDGKASCGPIDNVLVKLLNGNRIDETDTNPILISKRYQTCGISSRYDNTCIQTSAAGKLTCTSVPAIVQGGVESTKWICLNDVDISRLQKRAVRLYCYADCKGTGQDWRAV